MTSRIGFYSIRKTAREMCRLVTKFTPVIRLLFPESPALLAALDAANAACAVLVQEIDEVAVQGV